MPKPIRVPSYRFHKGSGQAVVTIRGRSFYLGKWESGESREAYRRIISEWMSLGGHSSPLPPAGPTAAVLSISELILAFWRHAEAYYTKDGRPTQEVSNVKLSLAPLRQLYGSTDAAAFGPKGLKAVRETFISAGLCRNECNRRTRIIVRMFRWAVEHELVPPSVHHGLKAVRGLAKGRSGVRESRPVRPVEDARVDAVRPFVAPQVWAMIQVQRLTGMRPGEVCKMRTGGVDRSAPVWCYLPDSHKTEHHDRERPIYLGPRAQAILKPWLRADPTAYLFQPREAEAARKARLRAARKSKVQPSQLDRSKASPERRPGEYYRTSAYHNAIVTACGKAGVEPWHPNQLRHSLASRLRREFNLDTARSVLGHASPTVTETYAELDGRLAAEAMARIG